MSCSACLGGSCTWRGSRDRTSTRRKKKQHKLRKQESKVSVGTCNSGYLEGEGLTWQRSTQVVDFNPATPLEGRGCLDTAGCLSHYAQSNKVPLFTEDYRVYSFPAPLMLLPHRRSGCSGNLTCRRERST